MSGINFLLLFYKLANLHWNVIKKKEEEEEKETAASSKNKLLNVENVRKRR